MSWLAVMFLLALFFPGVRAQASVKDSGAAPIIAAVQGAFFPDPILALASDTKQTTPTASPASGGKIEVILPFYMDGELAGDIFAVIEEETGYIQLDSETLIDAFYRALRKDVVNRLERLRGVGNSIASQDLLQQGITVEFDPDTVVLNVHTPLMARKKHLHNLYSRQQEAPASAARAIRPAPLSGAVDLFMVQEWQNGERQPSTVEADAYVNLQGWVLQNRQTYNAGAQQRWQRRETQLIKDWPDQLRRFSAGDVGYKSMGLMGNRPLSGFSLGTSFELQPYSVTYPLSQHEFFLEQDSQVDVYINGSFRTQLRLPAGRHDILDLPLIQGINQVTLEVTDTLGRTSSIEFFETLEQRLLRPGLDEYSFTLGVPRAADYQRGLEYETEMPALSAFYRTGLSEDLTIGGHLEASKEVAMGGATGVWNSLWGTLSYDVALSRDSAEDATGVGGFADYLFKRQGWSVNTSYRWEDQSFANLNQGTADNNTHYNVRFGLAFPRIHDWSCNLSVGQSRRWDDDALRSQRLSLSRSYPYGWRVSFDISHQSDGLKSESDAVLQVYWAPSGSRIQGSMSYASLDHARLAETRYQRQGELGLNARAFHVDSDRLQLDSVETSYVHSRLTSRLNVSQSQSDTGNSIDLQSLSFGTALAYADGYLAISRPLHGQPFALLSGKSSLRDQKVNVIRGLGNRPSVILDGAGSTAVLPNLSPYYANQVNLDVRELPIGIQIEQDSYSIMPSYRSGVSLEVGVEGKVYLIGRLVNPEGQPMGYVVGQLLESTRASGGPVLLFTDDQGHFEVAGLVPGRYTVRLDAPNTYRGELNVPEESFGILEIGDVVLQQR